MTGRPRVADLKAGDMVRLRKAHPCGGFWWTVNRVGGDVGLRCETCGHYVMAPRFRIERRIREIVRAAEPPHPGPLPPGERESSGSLTQGERGQSESLARGEFLGDGAGGRTT